MATRFIRLGGMALALALLALVVALVGSLIADALFDSARISGGVWAGLALTILGGETIGLVLFKCMTPRFKTQVNEASSSQRYIYPE